MAKLRYLSYIIVLAAAFLPLGAAFAANKAPNKTTWDVVAVKSAEGKFGFCRAETLDTATGLTLAVALSPTGEINMGIKVPNGGFNKGDTFPLTVTVEGTAFKKAVTAEAGLPELLLMRMGAEPALLEALTKGTTLVAAGEDDETRFALNGGGQMVETLKACVADGAGGKLDGAAGKPIGGGAPAAPAKTANGLPSGLANLLSEAQLNITPLKSEAPASSQAVDHAWTVGVNGVTLDGGFREQRVKKEQGFDSLIKATLDDLKKQCKPGLKVEGGKAETFPQLTTATYDLTCGDEFVALVAYRTGTDIYGQLMHRAVTKNKAAAIAARDRLAVVIRKLGQVAPVQ